MNRNAIFVAVAAVSTGLLTGCAGSASAPSVAGGVTTPVLAQTAATAPTAQAAADATGVAFWYSLARKGAVTNDEATKAFLSHIDDPAAGLDYSARVAHLKAAGMWPGGFSGAANAHVQRGDLAVAICKVLNIKGGLTSQLLGLNPRYATRALMFEGIYPDSTPNQGMAGAEFVGIIGAVDDRRRGSPADMPAEQIPGYTEPVASALDGAPVMDYRRVPLVFTEAAGDIPVYLMLQDGTAVQANATTQGTAKKLRVFVTAVQGEQAEVRRTGDAAWEKARIGMVLDEKAEFRTGDKSSIRFNIPPGQTFTLDRLGTCKVAEAAFDGSKVKTTVAMEQGRVRMDVNETGAGSKAQIERIDLDTARIAEAGVVHDTTIRSPNSALAVRGTKVSLFDQPPYAPRAVSLTGRAEYVNQRRQAVAFGAAGTKAQVEGNESGAAENAAFNATARIPAEALAAGFDAQQLNRVLATGGFIRGDVIVGNASVDVNKDFKGAELAFVLSFGKPGSNQFQDLNLAVISPLNTATNPDFIANGPFTTALNPNAPGYEAFRAANYPKKSASGGVISKNAVVAPESASSLGGNTFFRATEFAVWAKNAPKGQYRVLVYNFIDATGNPAGKGTDPVPATVNVISNGVSKGVLTSTTGTTFNTPVGLYEVVEFPFNTSLLDQTDRIKAKKPPKKQKK